MPFQLQEILWEEGGIFLERISGHEAIFVSTIGLDEEEVKKYIREQEKEDERLDQLKLEFENKSPSGDS